MTRDKKDWADRKEQDWQLEQVPKIIRCGDIFQSRRRLPTRGQSLRTYSSGLHFRDPDPVHAHGHNQCQCDLADDGPDNVSLPHGRAPT